LRLLFFFDIEGIKQEAGTKKQELRIGKYN
jgi:hypothetical protein